MNTFKSSAIQVLKKAGKPLHSSEITRLALEAGILVTEGATPEATMSAQLVMDVKNKGKASDFIKTGPGTFSLNPQKESKIPTAKNIVARSRPDTTGNGVPVFVPGFVKADVSTLPGNACAGVNNPCNVLFLEGGNQTGLPANDPSNDMVNILLASNVPEEPTGALVTTNRFGLEKTGGTFASLRMGQVYVDKAFVGGLVNTPLTTPVLAGTADNYIGIARL
jgi:hypothetical protein